MAESAVIIVLLFIFPLYLLSYMEKTVMNDRLVEAIGQMEERILNEINRKLGNAVSDGEKADHLSDDPELARVKSEIEKTRQIVSQQKTMSDSANERLTVKLIRDVMEKDHKE